MEHKRLLIPQLGLWMIRMILLGSVQANDAALNGGGITLEYGDGNW